jgi:hypothetical protein
MFGSYLKEALTEKMKLVLAEAQRNSFSILAMVDFVWA